MSKRKPIQKMPPIVPVKVTPEGRKWAFHHTLRMLRDVWRMLSVFMIRRPRR